MSVEKLRIRIIEINRPINKVEGSIKEIYRHFTTHQYDIAVRFEKNEISEFESVKVTVLNIGAPLYSKETLSEIFPNCEDLEERTHDSPEDFVDFIVDVSKEVFLKTLSERFEVEVKLLSEENGLLI